MTLADRVLTTVANGCHTWSHYASRCWADSDQSKDGCCRLADGVDGLCSDCRSAIRPGGPL